MSKLIKIIILILSLILICFNSIVFAKSLGESVIPQDANLRPYNAIVGQDADGNWQVLSLSNLGGGKFGIGMGTVTTQVTGSITAVTQIDKPIWEAQPTQIENITLLPEISPYGSYTYSATWTTTQFTTNYSRFLEYIVIVRDEIYPIDNYNFELHLSQNTQKLCLSGEVAPASGQSVFKPPMPLLIETGGNNGFRLIINNKCNVTQRFKVGIIMSWRRIW